MQHISSLPPTPSLQSETVQLEPCQGDPQGENENHTSLERTDSSSPVPDIGITGRKMWKRLKAKKSEQVWPPKLESALLEALQKYRPTSSSDPKRLQRFPRRNRFISDYVFEATGQRRTPKQVGSRLQQMRETCSEEHIRMLITRPDLLPTPEERIPGAAVYREGYDQQQQSPGSSQLPLANEPSLSYTECTSPSSAFHSLHRDSSFSPTMIDFAQPAANHEPAMKFMEFEDISFPVNAPPPSSSFIEPANICIEFVPASSPTSMISPNSPTTRHLQIVAPVPLWDFVPTATFSSTAKLNVQECRAVATVFLGDMEMHNEEAEVLVLENKEDRWIYGSKLVPSYWAELCKITGQDLSNCRISQVIVKRSMSGCDSMNPLFSVVYRFKNHSPSPPRSFPIPSLACEPQLPPFFPPTMLHSSFSYSQPIYYDTANDPHSYLPPTPYFHCNAEVGHAWSSIFAPQPEAHTESFVSTSTTWTFDDVGWHATGTYNPEGSLEPLNLSQANEPVGFDVPQQHEGFYPEFYPPT